MCSHTLRHADGATNTTAPHTVADLSVHLQGPAVLGVSVLISTGPCSLGDFLARPLRKGEKRRGEAGWVAGMMTIPVWAPMSTGF